MKKTILIISGILVLAFSLILSYPLIYSNSISNSFNRKLVNLEYKVENSIKLPSSFFYFAGEPIKGLYLKDLKVSKELYYVDFKLYNINKRVLALPDEISVRKNKVNIGVVDTAIYVSGNLSGNLNIYSFTNKNRYSFKNPNSWFDQTRLLSSSSIVGRGLSTINGNLHMKIINFNYTKNTIEKIYDLPSEEGKVFDVDGQLQLDKTSKRIFYMFFYKGSFLCLDTNLSLIYKAKTIDTVTFTTSKTASITTKINNKLENKTTQSNPRSVINRSYTLYQEKLYLVSSLKADNEIFKNYRNNQIIDVYSCLQGNYLYSFYIPKFKRKQLREFKIHNKTLYAIFDDVLVSYTLN